jgi:hypothetical protein
MIINRKWYPESPPEWYPRTIPSRDAFFFSFLHSLLRLGRQLRVLRNLL